MSHATDPSPLQPLQTETFEEVLERIRPKVRRMLANYRIPFPDAEDVLQEALVAAFVKGEEIRSLEFWLLGTLRYKCAFYWRKKGWDPSLGVDPSSLEELSPPVPPEQEREALYWDLEILSRDLGKKHREVLWLRFCLGLSHAEMAEHLGSCPENVRKLIACATARVRRRIQRKPREHRVRRKLD